ncbi:multiple sugar transport system permease protein [Paenibacillus barcinonensis]|uniref:Multiple sugar transport system permease protein n=2 Tax=Paenibacillus barcinonensis TaxID=198119 RepID=A0A2V4W3A0_PAEBA|nr:sugar ABC transporter permease [Paenibacillus barcinonensis]PYE49036.1 multiple sugar transport system permease protein [Paenibacillus barcinonensis]
MSSLNKSALGEQGTRLLEKSKKPSLWQRMMHPQARTAYLFLLPNLLGFLLFIAIPSVMALGLGFTEWDGYNPVKWNGLDNYLRLVRDENFRIALQNTLLYTFGSCLLVIIASLSLALLVNQKMKGMSLYRAAFFFPHIASFIAVAVVWQAIFNPTLGPLNMFLGKFMEQPPGWLVSSNWALLSIILVSAWKMAGYYMLLFLAGLQGISKELYEAANIDGANILQRFRNITLPMLSPVTFFVIITCIINLFKSFDLVYVMTGGGPGRSTKLLVYDIFVQSFRNSAFGYASAEAIVLFLIVLAITYVQFKGEKRWVNY